MTEQQELAIKCALADLQGALQAYERGCMDDHDWVAHRESIDDLFDAFPFLKPEPTPHPENVHFFAASVTMWATTTHERDLRQLIKLMEDDGHPFNLYLVPLPHDANYSISFFKPKVEGAQWLGYFDVKGKANENE